ncbi:hypothetical protein M2266_002141 [Streptomyces sp. SPB162]|nr:hypothetical protein [Streptomyces sp. SPB162]
MHRYKAKEAELGVSVTTVRRWVALVEESGPAGGLVSKREPTSGLDRVDSRWLEMARSVIKRLEKSSGPVRGLVLMEIEERVVKEYGPGVVSIPKQTKGYALLKELSRGTNAFDGRTKGKRSIANRPQGVFGRLRATRPGEYVALDTNSLDVFAMEPVTCRWVQCEPTVTMDLYSKSRSRLPPPGSRPRSAIDRTHRTPPAPGGRRCPCTPPSGSTLRSPIARTERRGLPRRGRRPPHPSAPAAAEPRHPGRRPTGQKGSRFCTVEKQSGPARFP